MISVIRTFIFATISVKCDILFAMRAFYSLITYWFSTMGTFY